MKLSIISIFTYTEILKLLCCALNATAATTSVYSQHSRVNLMMKIVKQTHVITAHKIRREISPVLLCNPREDFGPYEHSNFTGTEL